VSKGAGGRGLSTLGLEDTDVGVTKSDTDLGGETVPGELDYVVDDVLWCCLEPRCGSAAVWQSRGR
jgi:hypothetical protein